MATVAAVWSGHRDGVRVVDEGPPILRCVSRALESCLIDPDLHPNAHKMRLVLPRRAEDDLVLEANDLDPEQLVERLQDRHVEARAAAVNHEHRAGRKSIPNILDGECARSYGEAQPRGAEIIDVLIGDRNIEPDVGQVIVTPYAERLVVRMGHEVDSLHGTRRPSDDLPKDGGEVSHPLVGAAAHDGQEIDRRGMPPAAGKRVLLVCIADRRVPYKEAREIDLSVGWTLGRRLLLGAERKGDGSLGLRASRAISNQPQRRLKLADSLLRRSPELAIDAKCRTAEPDQRALQRLDRGAAGSAAKRRGGKQRSQILQLIIVGLERAFRAGERFERRNRRARPLARIRVSGLGNLLAILAVFRVEKLRFPGSKPLRGSPFRVAKPKIVIPLAEGRNGWFFIEAPEKRCKRGLPLVEKVRNPNPSPFLFDRAWQPRCGKLGDELAAERPEENELRGASHASARIAPNEFLN